jgi:PAS domain S-box-containing protein/putative nucleotidyltransferase with HDIG domain
MPKRSPSSRKETNNLAVNKKPNDIQNVMELKGFKETARTIFDHCKKIVDADGGYVGLLSEDGREMHLLFLDAGGRPCTVDTARPMPIRGLRGQAIRLRKAVHCNDLPASEWQELLPEGHVRLDNVLFAPLIIQDKVVGLLGLGNKPSGFNEQDAGTATTFADLAAIALQNSRTLESLEHSEERFRSVAQTASDAIISADSQGRIVFWNNAAQAIFGWPADEMIGKLVTKIMPEHYRADHQAGMQRLITTEEARVIGRTVELAGLRRDGSEFPVELSLSKWQTREGIFFAGIVRDITVRRQVEEALRKVHDELELRVQERTAELAKANEVLKIEITERKRAKEEIQRQIKHLNALHTIDIAIAGSLDLHLTLNIALEQIIAQLGMDAADVLLLNPHTQTLEYASGRGFRGKAIERSRCRLGEGHAGRAALERRTVHISDLPAAIQEFVRAELLSGEDFATYTGVPLIAKGEVKGILEVYHRTSFDPSAGLSQVSEPERLSFLEILAGQVAIAVDSAQLFTGLQRSNIELSIAYDTTIEGWSRALDMRDKGTEGHTQRVTELTLQLARGMGMSEAELVHIRRGCLLHDIGKMGIPDNILLKPGPLADEEWVIMRKHPQHAFEMLSPIAYLRPALDIPGCHHEKWDGSGYPRGLKGEQIPLAARIFAVIDVYDAMTSDRPYRKACPKTRVLEHIRAGAGSYFDPKVVEAFLRVTNEA